MAFAVMSPRRGQIFQPGATPLGQRQNELQPLAPTGRNIHGRTARDPTTYTVCTADGKVLTVPHGWLLLPSGDATLTRQVKAAGGPWGVDFSPDGRWLAASRRLPKGPEHETFIWEVARAAAAAGRADSGQ